MGNTSFGVRHLLLHDSGSTYFCIIPGPSFVGRIL